VIEPEIYVYNPDYKILERKMADRLDRVDSLERHSFGFEDGVVVNETCFLDTDAGRVVQEVLSLTGWQSYALDRARVRSVHPPRDHYYARREALKELNPFEVIALSADTPPSEEEDDEA